MTWQMLCPQAKDVPRFSCYTSLVEHWLMKRSSMKYLLLGSLQATTVEVDWSPQTFNVFFPAWERKANMHMSTDHLHNQLFVSPVCRFSDTHFFFWHVYVCIRFDILPHSVSSTTAAAHVCCIQHSDRFKQTSGDNSAVIFSNTLFICNSTFFFLVTIYNIQVSAANSQKHLCDLAGWSGCLIAVCLPACVNTHQSLLSKTSDGVGTVTYFRAIISHNMTEKLPPSLKSNQSAPAPISSSDADTNRQVEKAPTRL